nr:probable pectinesterase/pectinesterase inhibitor 21 [Tanacetum cinerariifolium]
MRVTIILSEIHGLKRLHGYALSAINPFLDDTYPKDHVFVDAFSYFEPEHVTNREALTWFNKPLTADGNEKSYMIGGLVLHNCTVKMDNDLETDVDKERCEIYLGRPWMPAATMAVIESDLGGFLNPKGYVPWPQAQNEKTCKFFGYKNRGPGASLENRVKWSSLRILKDDAQAQPYTLATFINGEPWLQHSGAPFRPGLVGS